MAEEFATVRRATIQLFRPLNETEWLRHGKANENDVSVRALAYIIAGHELHHMGVLRSRYLQELGRPLSGNRMFRQTARVMRGQAGQRRISRNSDPSSGIGAERGPEDLFSLPIPPVSEVFDHTQNGSCTMPASTFSQAESPHAISVDISQSESMGDLRQINTRETFQPPQCRIIKTVLNLIPAFAAGTVMPSGGLHLP
jgi:hypothetical protein